MKFAERDDITAQEIITLKNFAINYNIKNGTNIKVTYPHDEEDDISFIQRYAPIEDKMQYFKCNESSIKYGEDGRIISIAFVKK